MAVEYGVEVSLDDGRVVRGVSPDWDESDPRWDEPAGETDFEELVDGSWRKVSAPVSLPEYFRKASPYPDDVEPWE